MRDKINDDNDGDGDDNDGNGDWLSSWLLLELGLK